MTAAETILSRLASATFAGLSVPVIRSRVEPFDLHELPAINFKPKSESSTPMGRGLLACVLTLDIEVEVRGNPPDQMADPLAEEIDAALRADADLQGLLTRCFRSGKAWEFANADGSACQLVITYQMHYPEPA